MFVTSKELLQDARKNGYAVGAFNVENMEMVMAVVQAAEAQKSPVILQTTPGTIRYAGLDYYLANVKVAAQRAKVPVVMHLDHGNSFELALQAYRVGYTSIMIDGSKLSFKDNIALTASVAKACHASGIPVEGELGKVGGKEDDLEGEAQNPYTNPQEAAEFAEKTNVDFLAVGIGTAHGVYKGVPHVRVDILEKIAHVVAIPLVLHGTSGVPDEQVHACVAHGVAKVNYATDLRIAFTKGVKAYMQEASQAFDPKKYATKGMEEVTRYVTQKIEMLGSVGKA